MPSCLQSCEESKYVKVFPYISVFHSNKHLLTPIKNMIFAIRLDHKQPFYWFYQWIWDKNYTWMDLPIHEEDNGANPISINYCLHKLPPYIAHV